MKTYQYIVKNPAGLHARLAVQLAQICRDTDCQVGVEKSGKRADGKDVFSLMKLSVCRGELLRFEIEGMEEEEILTQVMELCERIL